MTKRADQLTLKVLKMEEKILADPTHKEERDKREVNINIYGIPLFESQDLEKRKEQDHYVVNDYLRFLGFADVNIVNLERMDGKDDDSKIRISFESPDIRNEILSEHMKSVRHERTL